jgi:predicted Zn-dependent protease
MKDFVYWILLLVVISASGAVLYQKYQETRPCAHPVTYRIGNIDPRFNISSTTVLTHALTSATIWNQAVGKTVLVYDENAPLQINFMYDEREKNANLGSAIMQKQASTDAARARLDTLQAQFVTTQSAYNKEVTRINARGGASQSEEASLLIQRKSLTDLANTLDTEVASYNANISALNSKVREYNQNAGHTFEEGEYVRDSTGVRINIFEFIGTVQLERVLAHEFGHAIGLDHNDDPKSIMYAKNESGNLIPTEADLTALQALCGK